MTGLLGLADDLTGALEIGALFLVPVITRADPAVPQSVVIDTETRHLSASEAACRVKSLLAGTHRLIYKKTDSTLRGNIGAELAVLLETFPGSSVLYAPAYPQLGRVVRAGQLYVDGVPVNRTAFGRDALNPVAGASIVELLGGDVPARSVTAASWTFRPGVVDVFDGETTADVEAVAHLASGLEPPVIVAGPGALASALAEMMGAGRDVAMPRLRRCLIVGGSRHPVSVGQIRWALDNGFEAGPWRVWSPPAIEGGGLEWASKAGRALADVLWNFDSMIVFGGDTAYGLIAALEHPPLEPLGEVLPGIPVSRVPVGGRALYLVTKAGGFGEPGLIGQLRRRLNSEESE